MAEIKMVEIPLRIAQRAARLYRPMMPYVRKFIADNRVKEEIKVEKPIEEVKPKRKTKMGAKK